MSEVEKFLELVKENPDLPIVPMVDSEIVADDFCAWWVGTFGDSEITKYYVGEEHVHFKDGGDDAYEILGDARACDYKKSLHGVDIEDLTDEELEEAVDALPWTKAIVVYITT